MCEAVVSCGDSAEVFEAAEHALNGVAITVEIWREAFFLAAVGLERDVGCSALAFDLAADSIAVVALVTMQDLGGRQLIEQGVGGDAICDLAARQQERDGTAEAIGQRADFRRPPRLSDILCK